MHERESWLFYFHNNIYITVFCIFASCNRAENTEFSDSKAISKLLFEVGQFF